MVILVRLLGIVLVGFGVAYLVNPNIMKQYIAFWKKGKRLYAGAAASLLIGIILLRAASQYTLSLVVTVFGILALIKGIVLFVLKPEKVMPMMEWWLQKPVAFLRGHAIIVIVIGVLLIYCA